MTREDRTASGTMAHGGGPGNAGADRGADRGADPEAVHAWARLVRVSGALVSAVEADLKAAGMPPLGWYDVLLELERAGDAGLRPVELQARLLIAQYNLSRLIDRMEAAGLVARAADPDDRRGQRLRITAEGLRQRKAAWPVYRAAIGRHVAARLGPGEAQALAGLLGKLAG